MSNAPLDPKASARAFYATQLRRIRTETKMTQAELGGQPSVMVSGKLIGHVENLFRPPTLRLSQGLDKTFGVPEFFEGLYAAILRESGVPSGFWEYTELESLAGMIRLYENFMINGLLQTEPYARNVLKAGQNEDKLEELVATRMQRQHILEAEEPPWLVALLDVAAIRRFAGDEDIMREQLEHLLQLMKKPHVTIHVVPDKAPVFPEGAFTLMSLRNEPDVGYVESAGGYGRIIQPGAHVGELAILFELIRSVALPAADSEALIRSALERL